MAILERPFPMQEVRYADTCHHTERFGAAAPDWYDFQETIDADLMTAFREALRKLEGLVYAVFGAVPDYENGIPWWQRDNPRCLWPEQHGFYDDPIEGERDEYWQYPATGVGQGVLGPQVPVRTRSGDPTAQVALAQHHALFPLGSVWRSAAAEEVFDPKNSSPVVIHWLPPAVVGLAIVDVWVVASPGTYRMNLVGAEYQAEIPAQAQGTVVQWHIHVTYRIGAGTVQHAYDPLGPDGPPLTCPHQINACDRQPDARYTYVSFTHVLGPYAYGFPELADWQPGLIKGTEQWQFDKAEDIQPAHINMARFLLNAIGRYAQHPPNLRGDPELCCLNMPVEFRWTGSNKHWRYRRGGKGGTGGVQPLTSLDGDAGNSDARKSWRGIDMLFKADPFAEGWPDNLYYGGDESWLAPYPDFATDLYDYLGIPTAAYFDTGKYAGLRADDVIDAVHLKEIIAAVAFFIDNGVWTTAPVKSFPRTPTGILGRACGSGKDFASWLDPPTITWENICPPDPYSEPPVYGGQCCKECSPECVPYDAPTAADCLAGGNNRCEMLRYRNAGCTGGAPGGTYEREWLDCMTPADYWPYVEHRWAGGGAVSWSCKYQDGYPPLRCDIVEQIAGWSAFLCGPLPYLSGPGQSFHGNGQLAWTAVDENHGNGWTKSRPSASPAEHPPSFGNGFDDAVACQHPETPGPHPSISFGAVTGVQWNGIASGWWGVKNCTPDQWLPDAAYPDIPGLGAYHWPGVDGSRERLCTVTHDGEGYAEASYGVCRVSEAEFPNCQGDQVYVRVNLNLTSGMPTLLPFDMDIRGVDDQGELIVPPVYPWSSCPSQT